MRVLARLSGVPTAIGLALVVATGAAATPVDPGGQPPASRPVIAFTMDYVRPKAKCDPRKAPSDVCLNFRRHP